VLTALLTQPEGSALSVAIVTDRGLRLVTLWRSYSS